jgi:hypothetical protein
MPDENKAPHASPGSRWHLFSVISDRSRPRRRRPRLFFVWLVQANLSPIAFSIQTLSHPGKPPHPQPRTTTRTKTTRK